MAGSDKGSKSGSPRVKRGAGRRKTKTGCRTCKIRRVKCDEARPACQRCVATGRVCDGYGIWGGGGNAYGERAGTKIQRQEATETHPPLSIPPLPLVPGVGPREQSAFDYFRGCTVIKLPGVFTSTFWGALVVQAGAQEPAVLQAMVALGAAHRSGTIPMYTAQRRDVRPDDDELLALGAYNRAIGHVRRCAQGGLGKESLRTVLITCLVFVCIEMLRGEIKAGRTHLHNGLALLGQIARRQGVHRENTILRAHPDAVDDYLAEALTRMDVLASLLGQSSLLGRCWAVDRDPLEPRPRRDPHAAMPPVFETVDTARRHLDYLVHAVYSLSARAMQQREKPGLAAMEGEVSWSRWALVRWRAALDRSEPALFASDDGSARALFSLPLLRLYHAMATVLAATCLEAPMDETVWDSHTASFAGIVVEARRLWRFAVASLAEPGHGATHGGRGFTADLGFIPPLYLVALKCRDRRLRRFAVGLLRAAPHREGVWDGPLVARAAEIVAAAEGEWDPETVPSPRELLCDENDNFLLRDSSCLATSASRISEVAIELPDTVGQMATVTCKRYGSGEVLRYQFDHVSTVASVSVEETH